MEGKAISTFELVRELWRQREAEPFPRGPGSERVDFIDLVLIDSLVAGCVSTYLGRRMVHPRHLDAERHASLTRCRDSLVHIVPKLDGHPRQYFERLLRLAEAVLADPASSPPP